MEFNPKEIVERYQQIKLITIRELVRLGFSAREISRFLGGSNKDSVNMLIDGSVPEIRISSPRKRRPPEIEAPAREIIDKYLQVKIVTIRELDHFGFRLREIENRLGGNNRYAITKLIENFQ